MEKKTCDSNRAKISKTCYFSMCFLLAYFFFIAYTQFLQSTKKNKKFKALAMNSWIKNDWQTALNASKKIANKCFYTAIKSDFLLNSNNHLKYLQQVK